MRNINELIGIIKGINYDGVINDKEILRLQDWADKNRNLAYEVNQIELIKLVDSVLEDHIIDENEKKLLLDRADLLSKGQGNNSDKLFELNGIIEGIISDDEVNEAEILNLKKWMDEFGDIVRNQPSTKKISETIDEILEDGVVTEDEQQLILDVLKERIQDTEFETKIEHLCRMVRARKNIGADIIDILGNESAIEEIHRRAELKLKSYILKGLGWHTNHEIIVVSLVLIAMLEYDGNYYSNVRNASKDLYAAFSEQKIEGSIRSILSHYKKESESTSRSRIISVALENAIVPQKYLSAFFEFVFDIYKLNFEYTLSDEMYDDFMFVYEGLRSNMMSDGDEFSINVTQKTYKLIKTTKDLIAKRSGLDSIIKLSIIVIKLIDKAYWDKELHIFNPYLKTGFEGWEKRFREESQKEKVQRSSGS